MLEQHEVAAYLLERRLISRGAIVSGRLRITDASSRNRNFRVSGGPGESYLLKQGLAADSAHTLGNEVALYRRLKASAAPVASWLPRFVGHDEAHGLLILEWIEDGEDLDRRGGCSPTLAAALGRALAALHAIAADDEELRRDPPWVLALHRQPLEALRYLSAAGAELIGHIQGDRDLGRALDELREDWRPAALVHRDVKFANCVAHAPPGAARRTTVKLVDWEMAGWGDPAVDVGSALGELAGRADAGARTGAAAAGARTGAAAALWRAYVLDRGLDEPSASALLARSVAHAGARLLQTAYETAQEQTVLSARVAQGLQRGRRLLVAPRDSAPGLLGIAA